MHDEIAMPVELEEPTLNALSRALPHLDRLSRPLVRDRLDLRGEMPAHAGVPKTRSRVTTMG